MKTIKIKDYYGIYQEIPVSDELYEEWRALQNETQRIHRKEVYHRDWTPMDDLEEMPQHFTLNELEDALIWDEQVVELYTSCPEVADEHSKEWIASTVKKIITEMISSGELQISAQTPAPETNGSSLAADDLAELGGVMGMFRTKG